MAHSQDASGRPLDAVTLRPASHVMSTRRAAGVVANALSFTRSTFRELMRGRWRIEKARFDLDAEGRGEILYRLVSGTCTFHFFLVSQKLDEAQKMDRNWAQSWDAMGVLCEGEWTRAREAHLRREVPKQRNGFADYGTLVYARGNRSGRLFDAVVASLAAGRQPDAVSIARVGYILRTTAFIANGQLGTRAYAGFAPDHPFRRPYHAQMVSAFVLREFVFDLVEHIARARNPQAVRLDVAYRRYLGLGNAAATGLVPFLANHPHLMQRWVLTNERALAQAKCRAAAPADAVVAQIGRLLDKAIRALREADQPGSAEFAPGHVVAADLARARGLVAEYRSAGTIGGVAAPLPWSALTTWAEQNASIESAELLDSIVLEVHPDIVEACRDAFTVEEHFDVQPAMTLAALRALVRRDYAWALDAAPRSDYYFWYRSAQAPRDLRRGIRGLVPALEAETAMETPCQVRALMRALDRLERSGEATGSSAVADLLIARPELRTIVRRVQSLAGCDYAELRTHWGDAGLSPFPPVRFVLALKGLEKFEAVMPKQVRGAFLQGAPIAEDVERGVSPADEVAWPFALIPMKQVPCAPATPLPPAGLGALLPATRVQPPDDHPDDIIRVAPNELARMIQTALQGHGVPLGVAEEAASAAMFAHACAKPVVPAALRRCDEGLREAVDQLSCRHACDARIRVFDAHGHSAFIAAPAALDAACATALTSADRVGIALVRPATDIEFLDQLALRAAERGLIGVAMWATCDSNEQAVSHAAGFAIAGPNEVEGGCWFAAAPLAAPSALHAQLVAAADAEAPTPTCVAGDVPALVTALEPMTPGGPGRALSVAASFALVCIRPAAADEARRLFEAIERKVIEAAGVAWSAVECRRRRDAWHHRGLPIRRGDFDALGHALAALWVPVAEEHRLRPQDGTDALRVF